MTKCMSLLGQFWLLVLLVGLHGSASAKDQSPPKIHPLEGFISTVTVEWNSELVPPTELNPAAYCAGLRRDLLDYLRAYGLYRPAGKPDDETVRLHVILNDPALKPGRQTTFRKFLGIPVLSGNATLTSPDGKIVQRFDISLQKTDSLQTSRDGSPWSWLSLRFARHIAENLHPSANGVTKGIKEIPDVPPGDNSARVVVFRRGNLWLAAVRPMILVDGTELGIIGPKKAVCFDLPPGKHTVAAIWNGTISASLATPPQVTDFEIAGGATLYFEFTYAEGEFQSAGPFGAQYREIRQTLDAVAEAEARPIVAQLSRKKQ